MRYILSTQLELLLWVGDDALPAVSVEQSLLASLSRITTCVVVVRAKSS